ncbi:MAG: TonB-dependent receptor [Thermodesulfobacteriota bacterium]
MRKSICTIVFFIFILGFVWSAAIAQPLKMEEVVVTATKTERGIEEVAGRIQVITKEDLQKAPGQKIDDYLNNISGINVIRSNGLYTLTPNVTLRGLSKEGGRTLVLINGVPINKSDTGEVNWNRINLEDVERIEIFKGPASSLYGNNAMGGVINIITKTPEKFVEGQVAGKYGTYNTYGGNLAVAGNPWQKDFGPYYRLSGFYQKSDGYISTPEEQRTPYTRKKFLEEGNASLILGYRFNKDHKMELAGSYFDDQRGEGTQILAPEGMYRDFDTTNISLTYQGKIQDLRLEFKAFYQLENYQRISESLRGTTYTRFDVKSERADKGALFHISKLLFPHNRLTLGFDFKQGSVDGKDEYKTSPDYTHNKGTMDLYALYLQDEFDIWPGRLNLIAGLRYDYAKFREGSYFSTLSPYSSFNGPLAENNWSALSPRISARYFLMENLSILGSYGRGFRASILDDLCRSGILWGLYKEANPNLQPETIDAYELGADYKPWPNWQLSASLFYSLGKDFLYFVPTGRTLAGRALYRRENIGQVEIYGGEFDIRYSPKPFTIFANYTYNHSEIKSYPLNPSLEGTELTNTPNHQIKVGLNWLNPYLNAGVYYYYKSSQLVYTNEVTQTTKRISEYHTVDLKFWREIIKNLTVSLTIQNVFDKKYLESDTDLSPGRFILGELVYNF